MRRSASTSLLALALAALVGVGGSAAGASTGSASSALAGHAVARIAKPATRPVARPAVRPVKGAPQPVRRPAGAPSTLPVHASSFAFLHVEAGAPVRWNPCTPVPWSFNPAGAPAGGLGAVRAALADLSARTGLTFSYVGTSSAVPTGGYLTQSWQHFQPLLVGWTTPARSDLLAGHGTTTVGVTRVLWTGTSDPAARGRLQIASGAVALNAEVTASPASWELYALHELGHAVGLAHVDDATQVMNPVIAPTLKTYGAGDLAGLRQVGSGGGCLPAIR